MRCRGVGGGGLERPIDRSGQWITKEIICHCRRDRRCGTYGVILDGGYIATNQISAAIPNVVMVQLASRAGSDLATLVVDVVGVRTEGTSSASVPNLSVRNKI